MSKIGWLVMGGIAYLAWKQYTSANVAFQNAVGSQPILPGANTTLPANTRQIPITVGDQLVFPSGATQANIRYTTPGTRSQRQQRNAY